jgi:hypothetical protein
MCMTVMPGICRHYVNNLVQYATGVEGITRKATREVGGISHHAVYLKTADGGGLAGAEVVHLHHRTVVCRAQIYTASKSALAWTDRLVLVAHNFTDVGQWPRIQVGIGTLTWPDLQHRVLIEPERRSVGCNYGTCTMACC